MCRIGDSPSDEEVRNSSLKNQHQWGYDLYPERKGNPLSWSRFFFKSDPTEKMKCEHKVYETTQKSKLVRLMMGALKSSGCPVNIGRHITCEVCNTAVNGGYDPATNQIVVCQNTSAERGLIQSIIAHEMIHMFDYCNNHVDFKNIDHLACTEIRAANLTHCSFLSAVFQGDTSVFNIKQKHQDCVKTKAVASIVAVRDVTYEQAIEAVERVFSKCYNDLEPIGRRIKSKSDDINRAYREAFYYGYDCF